MWRRRRFRSPLLFWTLTAVLALVTGQTVARLVSRAEAEAARYGAVQAAPVAARRLEPGDVLRPADVEVRRVPRSFLPPGVLADPPVGRTVVVPVFPGQALLREHIAPRRVTGVAALVPDGMRAVTVGRGSAPAPVRRNDIVDVLATIDGGEGEPTFAVAEEAIVVDVQPDSVTVAVTPDKAPRVAYAEANGAVTLALRR